MEAKVESVFVFSANRTQDDNSVSLKTESKVYTVCNYRGNVCEVVFLFGVAVTASIQLLI